MQTLLLKMIAISVWCGNVSPTSEAANTNNKIMECRRTVQLCLQEKNTTLQMESCFMGQNGGK